MNTEQYTLTRLTSLPGIQIHGMARRVYSHGGVTRDRKLLGFGRAGALDSGRMCLQLPCSIDGPVAQALWKDQQIPSKISILGSRQNTIILDRQDPFARAGPG